jgi:cell wall-associated NlpC family hydrolase
MIKKIAAISAFAFILTGCVSPNSYASETFVAKPAIEIKKVNSDDFLHEVSLMANGQKIDDVVAKLRKTVGKTWYVFSGNTPSGWDCSGLTMWTYQQLGITLEHRASKQQNAGYQVSTPNIGDIVVFTYKGYKSAYHVGIYIGNGKMIHAPEKGQRTRIESVRNFAGKYSKVTYRRLLNSL